MHADHHTDADEDSRYSKASIMFVRGRNDNVLSINQCIKCIVTWTSDNQENEDLTMLCLYVIHVDSERRVCIQIHFRIMSEAFSKRCEWP